MDPIRNPYTPNAGAQPTALVGRNPQLDSFDLLLGRLKRGKTEQSMIIKGLRGVGKTVLLGKFRQKALETDWVVLEVEVQKHDDQSFVAPSPERPERHYWNFRRRPDGRIAKRAAAVLKSFSLSIDPTGSIQIGFDGDPAEGVADHGNLALDLTDLMLAVGDAAQSVTAGSSDRWTKCNSSPNSNSKL